MGNFEKLGVLVIIILAVVIMIILIGGPQGALEPDHERARDELVKPTDRTGGDTSTIVNRQPPPIRLDDDTDENEWPDDNRIVQPVPPIPDPPVRPVLEDIKHVVKKNDSFYSLAKQYYGRENGKLYRRIEAANPGVSASTLKIGMELVIPHRDKVLAGGESSGSGGAASDRTSGGGDTYIVKKGDSLWKIAEKTLGKGSDYRRILDANRDLLAGGTDVLPGMELRIPR